MNKFQDVYREASEELPKLRLEAENVKDELHHRRMWQQRKRYLITRGCAAAVVFCLCCAGTAAAHSYRKSLIEVDEEGFRITTLQDAPEDGYEEGDSGEIAFAKIGGVFSKEGNIPEEIEAEEYEIEIEEYNSLNDFIKKNSVVMAVPDNALLGVDFTQERVYVEEEGRTVHIFLTNEDVLFMMDQFDYRDSGGYSLATSYSGRTANERNYINSQGLNYVMFDTVNEAQEVESIHAVISVNGRDLAMMFQGFEEEAVERILYMLDLGVYFQN